MINMNPSSEQVALSGALFGAFLVLFLVEEFTIYIFFGFCLAAYMIVKNWSDYVE